MKLRVTKEIRFEAADALDNYQGKCHDIHGHSYHLKITVLGEVLDDDQAKMDGMVIDFGKLNEILKTNVEPFFDHHLILKSNSRFKGIETFNNRVRYVPYQPTCENLLGEIVQIVSKHLEGVIVHSAFLRETPTSYAEWYRTDNE
ncbi:MAG: 6-carboxytetrahydropterin synthase [Flavobacteriales bacterium]|nr:6-carboxytetrahydropterin synthase [Flavobacteriales bacterium]